MSDSFKLRLAYLSPFNPVQSGISDYSEDVLPSLTRYAELQLFLDNYTPANASIAQNFVWQPASKFEKQAHLYDAFLLHMGNSAAHTYIYQALQKYAGSPKAILVLHDFVLHHFLFGYYVNRGKVQDYVRLMRTNYGVEGEKIAQQVVRGKLPEALFQFPLSSPAIEAAGAVIVHSRYAAGLIKQSYPTKKVGIVRMGVPLPPLTDQSAARTRLGLPQNEFILASLGHLNPYKRLDSALWAFKSFSREYPASRYILVGSPSPNYDVKAMIRALGLENKVQVVGFASDSVYQDYLAASDVCINLRYPTAGETSASLLRIMGAGRAVLVSRTGTFEELPDDVCIKVDVDEAEEELLLEYLRLLRRDAGLRLQLGQNTRNYVAQHARLEDAAYDYYLFLCQVLNRIPAFSPPPFDNVTTISSIASDLEASSLKVSNLESGVGGEVSLPEESLTPINMPQTSSQKLLAEVAQAASEIGLAETDPVLVEVAKVLDFLPNL